MRYFLLITSLLFSAQSIAGISLSQAVVHFEDGGKRSADVVVFNQGNETVYVKIEPSIILNPGTDEQKREVYRDPKTAGLLVTPQRLVIPAGSRKRVRFVRMDDPATASKDKVFRVLVKPEVGAVQSEQTAVKIIVAYEVLVLSQPKNAQHKLQSDFDGKVLKISNKGNTNVLLQKGIQCPEGQDFEDEKNDCVELSGGRVYAGATWQTPLTYSTPVQYQISVGLNNSLIVFQADKK